jgi:outer membrane lipoprotein-sorting protein
MRIRHCLAWPAFALFVFTLPAPALTADELVAKNIEARGGLAAIQAIKTLTCKGTLRFGGQFEMTFTRYQKAPDSLRIEAGLQGLVAVQAWDGNEAWQISPFQGRKDPERMSADDARALADEAPIGGPLADYRARGSRIEYLGTEDVDGTEAHKLKVTLANGDVQTVWLDPDYFLEIRILGQRTVRGTEVETVTDYGDYEKVAGVYFPFSISSEDKADGNRQQITIVDAEANVPVADDLFAFPAPAAASGK